MTENVANGFAFSSSLKEDVWHPQKDPRSYEWWYFDALSDDASEAVVVIFLDNFIYSPRYNKKNQSGGDRERFPAVMFTYFCDGKVVCRVVNEFRKEDFHSSEVHPECTIGTSGFRMESADYGSGYVISVNEALPAGKRLIADLEWLSVESDLLPDAFCYEESRHCWNMVSPRSDVSGKIRILDKKGRETSSRHFRGTGYHDHNLDNRWLARTVDSWHWGRVHCPDRTIVFYRLCETGAEEPDAKLVNIKDGQMFIEESTFEAKEFVRDKLGVRYPSRLEISSPDGTLVTINTMATIDSSFYFLRFLSEISLTDSSGTLHEAMGISEFISPKALRHYWLNRISDVWTGKNGRSSYF